MVRSPAFPGVANGLANLPMLSRHGGPMPAANACNHGASSAHALNPGRTAVQIVPALIGVILSMTMVLFTSGAITASANAAISSC
jgi:hypothetical protein